MQDLSLMQFYDGILIYFCFMKIKLFGGLILLILITSCKDDDTSGDYIGSWIATNIEITDCENFTLNDSRSVQCTDNSCYRIVFTDSSAYTFQRGLEFERGTWGADGVNLTFCTENEGEESCRGATGVISVSGMRLSFVEGNEGCITAYIMVREEVIDEGNPG